MISKHLPLVTVGIPTYNRSRILPRAIKSILNQTYKNIEIIISDNCSTDKTASICKSYANSNKHIRYFHQSSNYGYLFNYLFVLRLAKGKYFMWASDDDFRNPTYIKDVVDLLESDRDAVLGVTDAIHFNSKSKHLLKLPFRRWEDSFDATKSFLINPQVVSPMFYGIFKTSTLRSVGIHTDIRPMYNGSSDILTIVQVLLRGNLAYISKPLIHIKDSAHYHDKFDLMKSHVFTPDILLSIKRYLTYPIMFFLDFLYSIRYIFISRHSFQRKIILSIMTLRRWITENIMFIYNIIKGVVLFVYGYLE